MEFGLSDTTLLTVRRILAANPPVETAILSVLSQIENPSLREHIERVGKVFYSKR